MIDNPLFNNNNPRLDDSIALFKEMMDKGESKWYEVHEILEMAEYSLDNSLTDQDAMDMVEYALRLHPDNSELMILKAKLYVDRDEIDLASQIAHAIPDTYSKSVKLLSAEIALNKGENDEADFIISGLVEDGFTLDENDYIEIANLYYNVFQIETAIEYLEKGISHFPDNVELKRELASFYSETNETTKGKDILNSLLDKDPYSVEDWQELANQHYLSGDYEKAVEASEFVLAIEPQNVPIHFLLGHCYLKLENFEKALESYTAFAEKVPSSYIPYLFIGFCNLSLNEVEKAEENFQLVLTKSDSQTVDRWEIFYNLAIGYYAIDNYGKAIDCLNQGIAQSPGKAEPYIFKGRFYYEIGDPDNAYEMFLEALKLEEFSIKGYLKIIKIYIELKDYKQPLNILRIIRDKEPDHPQIIMYLAFCYYFTDKMDKFEYYFERIVKEFPEVFHEFILLLSPEEMEIRDLFYKYRDRINLD